jgi:hypothetical protein
MHSWIRKVKGGYTVTVEYGDGGWKSPFPREWGRPPGAAYSEERSRWVKSKVRQHVAGQPMRQLRQRQLKC